MIQTIDRTLAVTLAILMAAIVADVSWQVFTRFFTASPSSWTEEVARFLLIWIGLLGAAWAYRQGAHLGLDVLIEKASPRTRLFWQRVNHLAVIAFALFALVYGGYRLVSLALTLNQISPALGIPIGYVYLVLPLSGLLITIYAAEFLRTSGNTTGEEA